MKKTWNSPMVVDLAINATMNNVVIGEVEDGAYGEVFQNLNGTNSGFVNVNCDVCS